MKTENNYTRNYTFRSTTIQIKGRRQLVTGIQHNINTKGSGTGEQLAINGTMPFLKKKFNNDACNKGQ